MEVVDYKGKEEADENEEEIVNNDALEEKSFLERISDLIEALKKVGEYKDDEGLIAFSAVIQMISKKKGVQREMNIVGGDLLKYWSKCIIELKNNNGKRKAVLLKHRSLPQKEMSFEIRETGVFRRGWL